MNKFRLFVYNKAGLKELLELPNNKRVTMPFLGLTSMFVQTFEQIYSSIDLNDEQSIEEFMENFYGKIHKEVSTFIDERKYTELPSIYDYLNEKNTIKKGTKTAILEEFLLILIAIELWLFNSEKELPSVSYCNHYNIDEGIKFPAINSIVSSIDKHLNNLDKKELSPEYVGLLYFLFEGRIKLVEQNISGLTLEKRSSLYRANKNNYSDNKKIGTMYKKTFAKVYSSKDGLLPLIWSEILYCIENNIIIKKCPECKKLFTDKPSVKYCSEKCRISTQKRLVKEKKNQK